MPAETALDDIVRLASQCCDAPMALIGLADHEGQQVEALFGTSAASAGSNGPISRSIMAAGDLLVVPDLTVDSRFADDPLVVDGAAARFLAGVPLVTIEGQALGALCVMDRAARPEGLRDAQRSALRALARLAAEALEVRAAARRHRSLLEANAAVEARQRALLEVGDALRDGLSVGEMTRRAAEIVGRTLRASRAGYGIVDADLTTIDVEPDWTAPGVPSIAGRHRFADYGELRHEMLRGEALVIDDVDADPRTAPDPSSLHAIAIRAMVNVTIRDQGRLVGVFIVHDRQPRRWTADDLAFIRGVADRLEVGIARLTSEEQQALLNGELAHRLKNSLAMVQAIANRTLRGSTDPDRLDAFQSRLRALGTAHDVLLMRSLRAADLNDIVSRTMEAAGVGRYTAKGPTIAFGARATLSTALLIHELATNALKYGALSTDGSIEIAWACDGADADAFTLDWIEHGGPAATPPVTRGFGSRLLSLGLVGTGGADLRYSTDGFRARFVASREHLEKA